MKTIFGILLLVVTFCSQTWAADSLFKGNRLFEVTPESQTQKMIDQAISSIFDSPLKKDLCKIFPNSYTVMYSLGVGLETAEAISKKCPSGSSSLFSPEIFRKRYFIALDPDSKSLVQSWTTTDNKTLLFVDKNLTVEKLRQILIHEIYIGVDAKMNMMLSTYFIYENLNTTILGNRAVVVVDSKGNEDLQKAFNVSIYPPIAMSFATMRAMNMEKIILGQKMPTENHLDCMTQFYSLYSFFKEHQEDFKEKASLQAQVQSAIISNIRPANPDAVVKSLLSRSFVLEKSDNATFCQYMARPLMSGKSAYSFYANGPRPRIGDGWSETSGVRDSRSQSNLSSMIMGETNNQSLPEVSEDILNPFSLNSYEK